MAMIDDFHLLEKYGFKMLPYYLAKSEDAAAVAAKRMKYPVALKIVSPEIEHKTDFGGVKIDIRNEDVLRIAYRDILQRNAARKIEGVLVQKMARRGVELIIGGKKDSQFGHMVVLGLGGIYVEIFKDISARICPVAIHDVEEMISELKAHPVLEGARGKKAINKKMLEALVVKACKFMEKEDIKEMDLNPVIFDDKGGDIVDVRFSR